MAINKAYKHNFETLQRACRSDNLALMECTDAATGKKVIVVVAVDKSPSGEYLMVPVAKMFDGNPFEELIPPQLSDDAREIETDEEQS